METQNSQGTDSFFLCGPDRGTNKLRKEIVPEIKKEIIYLIARLLHNSVSNIRKSYQVKNHKEIISEIKRYVVTYHTTV